ncbi:MAG: isoprenylcysteine carboxylmethyltransferase family protein [Candidatus Aenigmarchaeota archaeon]|nr:isoprenylcysteine carboxylmethyltransferase family protein [Candidatus Aenigmarchaeota archaeon]
MYYVFFAIAFVCFVFHTTMHVLEHFEKVSGRKSIYAAIGVSMLLGWSSYFYISFSSLPASFSVFNLIGLIVLIAGFYLFFVSQNKVHKRMHSGKGGLVTDGIYRRLRHPMYLGEILMFIGTPILGQSMLTLFLSPIFIVQILIWRYFEEQKLVAEFPEYSEYKKRTLF